MKKIIGLAGTFASGKDTVADIIAEKFNYLHVSTGDIVRDETKKLGHSIHRDNLVWVANKLRSELGTGVLVERAIEKYKSGNFEGLIISGIRHPGEVEALHNNNGILLFTDAPIEKRYQWAKQRGRLEDNTTLEGFKKQEQREMAHPDKGGQNIQAVRKMADVEVKNEGTKNDLVTQVEKVLKAAK